MVLPVKKMLTFTLCVSTFAALDVVSILALHPQSQRRLESVHHTIQYAPKVVKQPKDTSEQDTDIESSDSYDSQEVEGTGSLDIELLASDALEISSSQDLDLDVDGAADVDIFLANGEGLDYDGKGEQMLDLSSSLNLDLLLDASLDASNEMDTDIDFTDGTVDVELDDDEDYTQDLEFKSDEFIDELIDVPVGTKYVHLRVYNGNVDLDIIKGGTQPTKNEAQLAQKIVELPKVEPKEEVKNEEKGEEKTISTATKEVSVSYAAEAKEWIGESASKYAILGSIIGAAVGVVGIAGMAIFKSRKRASDPAEDAPADVEADIELDESEAESACDSDEDVEAGATGLKDKGAKEEKNTSVVEGSV